MVLLDMDRLEALAADHAKPVALVAAPAHVVDLEIVLVGQDRGVDERGDVRDGICSRQGGGVREHQGVGQAGAVPDEGLAVVAAGEQVVRGRVPLDGVDGGVGHAA